MRGRPVMVLPDTGENPARFAYALRPRLAMQSIPHMPATARRTRSRWLVGALALACMLGIGATPAEDPLHEALRTRVEQIHDDPDLLVRDVHIAARRALPAFYEQREFALAWTAPEARADLLRAVRDSYEDGLDPEDYLLSALEAAAPAAEPADAPLDARIDYDILLTDALARLLYHLIFGKVNPRDY